MEQFDVYTYYLPKVSDEGKSIPIPPSETKTFDQLDEAQQYAAQHQDKCDRVVVIQTEDGNQRLVERYIDGEHSLPEDHDD